ncbi:MAG: hypothetical protein HY360_17135 [Verrucomicrobia bacterium]|nr:hypothetical protein [Verrucomicrobiota bacterium]
MIVHHGFDMSPREFESKKAWPIGGGSKDWKGEYASQSPLNAMYVTHEGGGAEGTLGYLALPGSHAEQFYAEATPYWNRPRQTFDLRNTRASLYLKAITPIETNPVCHPHLFIDDYCKENNTYCGWFVTEPLRVGTQWTFNQIDLLNDEKIWTRYSQDRSLDAVLSNVGFIGVMYFRESNHRYLNARGILGIDELKYNIPLNP